MRTRTRPRPSSDDTLGIYLDQVSRHKRLSRAEEQELGIRSQRGDELARERLVTANLRLVVHIARQRVRDGVSLMDLIQAGNLGLMDAATRYDPISHPGTTFSIYSAYWIKNRIEQEISGTRGSVPKSRSQQEREVRIRRLESRAGERGMTEAEIAEETGYSSATIRESKRRLREVSIDEPVGGDGGQDGVFLRELLEAEASSWEEEVRRREGLVAILREELPEREAEIMIRYFGLNGRAEVSREALGGMIGDVSRERVRQLDFRARSQIRASRRITAFLLENFPDFRLAIEGEIPPASPDTTLRDPSQCDAAPDASEPPAFPARAIEEQAGVRYEQLELWDVTESLCHA